MLFAATGMSADVPIQRLLTEIRIGQWLQDDLFHFHWWLLLSLFVFSIVVWWRLVDKARLPEISLFAGFTVIATLVLDELGEELALWDYPIDILPIFPPLTAVDLATLPIVYSLVYQYCGTWRSFCRAMTLVAAVFAFVCEPLLVWGDFYQLLKWQYYYGVPIYIVLAILIRWTVIKIYAAAGQDPEAG